MCVPVRGIRGRLWMSPLWCARSSARSAAGVIPVSLSDTEAAEDLAEQIVRSEGARDLAERVVRKAQFLGQQIECRVRARSHLLSEREVRAGSRQRIDMPRPRNEDALGRCMPAGDVQQARAKYIEALARARGQGDRAWIMGGPCPLAHRVGLVEHVHDPRALGQARRDVLL